MTETSPRRSLPLVPRPASTCCTGSAAPRRASSRAAALKCVGGGIQGKLWPRTDEERQALVAAGYDLDRVLMTDDLVASDDVFVAATGVTTGALLRGVRYVNDGAVTDSLVMRSRSGMVCCIEARHKLSKLRRFTGREY